MNTIVYSRDKTDNTIDSGIICTYMNIHYLLPYFRGVTQCYAVQFSRFPSKRIAY